MVPKGKKGRNFKGAARYFLHDKKAKTRNRIEFIETLNLPTDDPDMAIKMMAYTASHHQEIKNHYALASDVKEDFRHAVDPNFRFRTTGNKLKYPVYHFSLSWHYEEKPTKQHMIQTAKSALTALKIRDKEALIIAHNDEPHPHVHVIVNRVDLETGIAAKLDNDHLKLSKWAQTYEETFSRKIYCNERVKNNARRAKGEFVKDTKSLSTADFYKWRKEKLKQAFAKRQEQSAKLSEKHKAQRDKLFDRKEARIKKTQGDIKERNRPTWADLYQRQREERFNLAVQQRTTIGRLKVYSKRILKEYLQGKHPDIENVLSGAFNAIVSGQAEKEKLLNEQEQQRKDLSRLCSKIVRKEIVKINDFYKNDLEELKEKQRQQTLNLKRKQDEESKEAAKKIKSGEDWDEYKKLMEKIKKQKKKIDSAHKNKKIDQTKKPDYKKIETEREPEKPPELKPVFDKKAKEKPEKSKKKKGFFKKLFDRAAGAYDPDAPPKPPKLKDEFERKAKPPEEKDIDLTDDFTKEAQPPEEQKQEPPMLKDDFEQTQPEPDKPKSRADKLLEKAQKDIEASEKQKEPEEPYKSSSRADRLLNKAQKDIDKSQKQSDQKEKPIKVVIDKEVEEDRRKQEKEERDTISKDQSKENEPLSKSEQEHQDEIDSGIDKDQKSDDKKGKDKDGPDYSGPSF